MKFYVKKLSITGVVIITFYFGKEMCMQTINKMTVKIFNFHTYLAAVPGS